MKIEEIKRLEGSREQIKRLAELVEEKKLTQTVYWEIRAAWSRAKSQYKEVLGGDLVNDAKQVFGNREIIE